MSVIIIAGFKFQVPGSKFCGKRTGRSETDALASGDAWERTQLREAKSCNVMSDEQLLRKETHRLQKIMEILQSQYTDKKVVPAESSEDSADAAGPVHQEAG